MTQVYLPDGSCVSTEAGTVEEILARLDCNPYEVLATCDGELLLADDICSEDAVIRLMSIIHGG